MFDAKACVALAGIIAEIHDEYKGEFAKLEKIQGNLERSVARDTLWSCVNGMFAAKVKENGHIAIVTKIADQYGQHHVGNNALAFLVQEGYVNYAFADIDVDNPARTIARFFERASGKFNIKMV